MRLLFQKPNQSEYHHQHPQGGKANKDQRNNNNNNVDGTGSQNNNKCMPVSFDIKNGRKYLIYVKKVSTGRYVAVATPDLYTRKSRKVARKLLCKNCGKTLIWKNLWNVPNFKTSPDRREIDLQCTFSRKFGKNDATAFWRPVAHKYRDCIVVLSLL